LGGKTLFNPELDINPELDKPELQRHSIFRMLLIVKQNGIADVVKARLFGAEAEMFKQAT
jgi:hypothetical protein